MQTPLLSVENLVKHFSVPSGRLFGGKPATVRAVDGVNFQLGPGDTFGLVGESGCGKTTVARCILRLEEPTAGAIRFAGQDVAGLQGAGLHAYRRRVQAVFQDPYSALSPRMRNWQIVAEPLFAHERVQNGEARRRVQELLELVGLEADHAGRFPHELSGGQRQRVAIARALALHPQLIVLDEPVSALDVSIRAQVLNLLRDLQRQLGLAYLFIAHDLAVVLHTSTVVGVMYLGVMVECAPSEELFARPLHPYTRGLFEIAQAADISKSALLEGEVPSPLDIPTGCRFRQRCPAAAARCVEEPPALRDFGKQHVAACHFA